MSDGNDGHGDPQDSQGDLIEIARLGRPHGVKGRITLVLHNEETALFDDHIPLLLGVDEPLRVTCIDSAAAGRLILGVEGVESREAAAVLTGKAVYVRRGDLPDDDDDGWYLADLMELAVVDESGRILGRVEGVLPTGGVDVLEIGGELGPWMMPAADEFIVDVDFESGRIVVSPPKGLVPETETE